jgi:eukaryotic-like serine/threonine-protein kinase
VAFVGIQNGAQQLYLRALDSPEAMPMAGTEGAYCTPAFSPDGQWLSFFSLGTNELKKTALRGGPPVTLTKAKGILGASWEGDNAVIYGELDAPGLKKISSAGGMPVSLTQVDASKGETAHYWPAVLPGAKVLLFAIQKGENADEAQIVAQRLDTGERRVLIQGGTFPQYVSAGYLVYVHGGKLMAAPFDAGRLEVQGQAIAVSESIHESAFGASQFGLSSQGSLVYVPPVSAERVLKRKLLWVSRNGTEHPLPAPAQDYGVRINLSPDGRRAAVSLDGQIWVYDLSRDIMTRLTFEGDENDLPLWSPDGKRIAYWVGNGGLGSSIFWQLADGSGGRERLTPGDTNHFPVSWSPDGRFLAFVQNDPVTKRDIWMLRLSDRSAQPFLRTPFNEAAPSFSPDGRWLAYASDESGRPEIYVQPFPGPGGKWLVSSEGGTEPMWNPKGRELFYRSGNKMMAVDVATQPSFSAGKPRALFEGGYANYKWPQANIAYGVSPDGQRFLMTNQSGEAPAPTQINVVLNWFEELKRRAPSGT